MNWLVLTSLGTKIKWREKVGGWFGRMVKYK